MRAVILSGGSEIISVSLVEEFLETGIPLAILSLGGNSLLRGVVPDAPYAGLAWPPKSPDEAIASIGALLEDWGDSAVDPWPIFPTEDGGLRLILQYGATSTLLQRISRASRLKLGGLDKAELFDYLNTSDCVGLIAPTQVVTNVDQVETAVESLGGDCVIKPALKPLSMKLTGMKSKAFMTQHYQHSGRLLQDLANAWALSETWVVQKRLRTPTLGERVFWAVRDSQGGLAGMAAVERWKQPRDGGTGCWVVSDAQLTDTLFPIADKILTKIDFRGLCELPFLLDDAGGWRLLELNPRPWLQVGLANRAGVQMASLAYKALLGDVIEGSEAKDTVSWVNLERLLLAAVSGEYGWGVDVLRTAWSAWRTAGVIAVHDSPLPHVRQRWVKRMAAKPFRECGV